MKRKTKLNGNIFGVVAYSLAFIASLGNAGVSVKQKDREELTLSLITGLAVGICALICLDDVKHNIEREE